jgi:hypothetical protein
LLDEFVKKYPEKCNEGCTPWMEIRPDTVQYLDFFEEFNNKYGFHVNPKYCIIHGNITYDSSGSLSFVYDNPIVSRGVDKEYYRLTRGKIVWEVSRNKKLENIMPNNE